MLHCKSKVVILPFLPRARMRSKGKAMPSCVSAKKYWKCFEQGRKVNEKQSA